MFVGLCSISVVACKHDDTTKSGTGTTTGTEDEDTTFAEDGSDSTAADGDAQLVASSLVASTPGALGLASTSAGELGTQNLGDGVKAAYLPRTCVVANAKSTTEATFTFTNCLFGPSGITNLSGTIDVHVTSEPTKLTLVLTYTKMVVNGASFDGSATAIISAPDSVNRSMEWKATLDGTTAHDKPFSFQSDHTLKWMLGEACFHLEGFEEGQVRARAIKTEVTNFSRCRRGCPDPGGQISVTNEAKNKVVTIDFDGTAVAKFTNVNGKVTNLPLLCKP
jgi:hypothetical protein